MQPEKQTIITYYNMDEIPSYNTGPKSQTQRKYTHTKLENKENSFMLMIEVIIEVILVTEK